MNFNNFFECKDKPDIKVKKVWLLTNLFGYIVFFLILIGLETLNYFYNWSSLMTFILVFIFLIGVFLCSIEMIFINKFKYNIVSFDITKELIIIKSARFWCLTVKTIPTEKVYYIDMKSGPFLKKYNLCNLIIGTMAYQHEIEGIHVTKANSYKNRVYEYASIGRETSNGNK